MSNPYMYNNYQQYSPSMANGAMNNTSPTFHHLQYLTGTNSGSGSLSSASSTASSVSSNYSLHNPRMRYYLSKSFDLEDDLEFCPDIPETNSGSPTIKKFNPYTATVFSPTSHHAEVPMSPDPAMPQSPRVHTPRIKKPIEIVNPNSRVRIGSPATR